MARRTRRTASASPEKPVEDRVIDATLELAVLHGWSELTLGRIARTVGLSLSELYDLFPSKTAILGALVRRVDRAMVAAVEEAGGPDEASARDRLFEVAMARFDAMRPHKDGIRAIARDTARDPLAALCGAFAFRRSLVLMLESAGLSSAGLRGMARLKGLGLVVMATMRVWLTDDSEDMGRTMAALDRNLGWAERAARFCARGSRRRASAPDAEAAADELPA